MTIRTKKEAELAAKKVKLEFENKRVSEANTVIFADYFEQWVNDNSLKIVRRSTMNKYESELKRMHEFCGKTLLSDITRPLIGNDQMVHIMNNLHQKSNHQNLLHSSCTITARKLHTSVKNY